MNATSLMINTKHMTEMLTHAKKMKINMKNEQTETPEAYKYL